jgi:hypothetical protein
MFRVLPLAWLCLLAAPSQARDLELHLGSRVGWGLSHTYVDQFDSRLVAGAQAAVAMEVLDDLFAEVGFGGFTSQGRVFQEFLTRWHVWEWNAGARYQWRMWSWLRPFARVNAALLKRTWSLGGPDFDANLHDYGFQVIPSLGVAVLYPFAGLEGRRKLFDKFSFGMTVDLGFRYTTPMSTAGAKSASPVEGVGSSALDLGQVDANGLVLGFTLFVLF